MRVAVAGNGISVRVAVADSGSSCMRVAVAEAGSGCSSMRVADSGSSSNGRISCMKVGRVADNSRML